MIPVIVVALVLSFIAFIFGMGQLTVLGPATSFWEYPLLYVGMTGVVLCLVWFWGYLEGSPSEVEEEEGKDA